MRIVRPLPRPVSAALLSCALAALFWLCPGAPARAQDQRARAQALTAAMSIPEKVGQTLLVFFEGPDLSPALRTMIATHHVGGLLLYDSAGNVDSMDQVARLTGQAQALALSGPRGLGLFIAVDQEGGPVARLREGFAVPPPNMALGATASADNAALAARVTARQLKALGVNMNLAPVVDVNSNPANPIIGVRSYGENPQTVARFGAAAVRAHRAEGVMACAKHFPGHGDTGYDSHVRLPTVPHALARLRAVELTPFAAAVAARVPAVMTAHVEVPALEPEPGLPATMSSRVLEGLLRRDMGFGGLIISDSLTMGAVAGRFDPGEAAVRAFLAGADVLCFGADKGHRPEEQLAALRRMIQAVESGEIPMSRLDAAVNRIVAAKLEYGIAGTGEPPRTDPGRVNTPEDREAVRRLAGQSITLLRDRNGLLPLTRRASGMLLWPGGDPRAARVFTDQSPGFTAHFPAADPAPEARAELVEAARQARRLVVFTRRADRNPGQAALVNELLAAGLGPRLAVVSLDVPYDAALTPEAPCLVAAWSDAPQQIDALTRMLFGLERPSGRLPVTIPGLDGT
jgi:beta-N-acetylhexosaminidase